MRKCVVIPTYNEIENIDDIISGVLEHDGIDILIADDSSPDGTAERVNTWSEKTDGRVRVHVRPNKEGLGAAYLDGFGRCIQDGYDIICQMDADLSHDPAALPSLIAPIENNSADVVLGSRYVKGGSIPAWAWHRRLLSRGGNMYARFMLGISAHDATGGYRAYRATTLAYVISEEIRAEGYGFQIEMTYQSSQAGARITEVPIAFRDRIRGLSKMSLSIVVEALTLVTWWAIRDRIFRRKSKYKHKEPIAADTTRAN